MLYNERAEVILQQLKLQSTVKVGELSQLLQVSVDTVRRDLKAMEQAGLVKCLRGGACLPESLSALSNFEGRAVSHSDLKRGAARKRYNRHELRNDEHHSGPGDAFSKYPCHRGYK